MELALNGRSAMKIKRMAFLLPIGLVAVGALLLFSVWSVDQPATPQALETPSPASVDAVDPLPEAQAPAIAIEAVEPSAPVAIASATPPPPPPPEPGASRQTAPGEYLKYPSDDLQLFMTIGSVEGAPVSAGTELEPRERAMLKAMLRTNDLTDEELRKVMEYAKIAWASSHASQAKEQERICSNRQRITNLDQAGALMNMYRMQAETYQEELGRNAASYLGNETFMKLSRSVLTGPKHAISAYDYALRFHATGRNVEEVMELFCSYKK